jgi:hypothetical protein
LGHPGQRSLKAATSPSKTEASCLNWEESGRFGR